MSQDASPERSIFNSIEPSPATYESASSQSPESEDAETSSTARKQAKIKSIPDDGLNDGREYNGKRLKLAKGKQRRQLNSAYRDLLNSDINDVRGFSHNISQWTPSYVGESYWNPTEKHLFFSKLPTSGSRNVEAIAKSIGSKSQAEVGAYVLMLQQNCTTSEQGSDVGDESPAADIPAAREITQECAEALDLEAVALEGHVQRQEIDVETQKFSDTWLIDEEIAEEIERPFKKRKKTKSNPSADEASSSNTGQAPGAANTELESESGVDEDGAAKNVSRSSNIEQDISAEPDIPFAYLLRPQAFLKLSRQIFMNGPSETDSNWEDVEHFDHASSSPALFRSAFDDFHEITRSLTRRLVQTTLFQAQSRLRAKDEQGPVAAVIDRDVRSAADVLGLNVEWKKYWATLPRSLGLDVLRHAKGESIKQSGVEITLEDAEAELGLSGMIDESADSAESLSESEGESESEDEADSDSVQSVPQDEGGDEYLDFIDQKPSRVEEQRLWSILGIESQDEDESDT